MKVGNRLCWTVAAEENVIQCLGPDPNQSLTVVLMLLTSTSLHSSFSRHSWLVCHFFDQQVFSHFGEKDYKFIVILNVPSLMRC